MRPLVALLLALAVAVPPAWGQAKVRINWTAVSGAMSGVWVAHEEGFFKKHGVDVELVHIASTSRAIQTMLAGELAFSPLDGRNSFEANLQGADVVLLAGITNRLVFSLMARPELTRVADLRGKKIGITRIGSTTHSAGLVALGGAGLKPGDYELLPLMEVPNILSALVAGQVDGGIVSPPTNSRARRAGFNELVNLARDGPEYVGIALGTTRSYVKANEDVAARVVRAYAEAVHLFKTSKPTGLRVLQKYTKVTDPGVLEDTYSQFHDSLESIPHVSRKGLAAILNELSDKEPRARSLKPDDVLDERFVTRLDQEGFFRKLWGK
jgi:ABC-type nitrate/sulfonate/bicarbonate transport system substrate-binding protein